MSKSDDPILYAGILADQARERIEAKEQLALTLLRIQDASKSTLANFEGKDADDIGP